MLGLPCREGFCLVAASRFHSLVVARRLLTAAASLAAEHGLSGGPASAVVAPRLWSTGSAAGLGLAAPRHVGSSQIRDRTGVSCIVRWTLCH